MANYSTRARKASIFDLLGCNGFLLTFVFVALLLLLTPTLLSNQHRTKQWPRHTEISGADDGRRSPSNEHSGSKSRSSAENGRGARFSSQLVQRLPPSSPPLLRRPVLQGIGGDKASKLESVVTTRSDDVVTVSKMTRTSTDDSYGINFAQTRATNAASRHIYPAEGHYSTEHFVATHEERSRRSTVAATSKTAPAVLTSAQSQPDEFSTVVMQATLTQQSTSASSSIKKAGKGVVSAAMAAKQTLKSHNGALEGNAGRKVVAVAATTATALKTKKVDDVPTVYIGFEKKGARLGNRMFQYASGLALALRYNRRAAIVLPNNTAANSLDAMRRFFRLSTLQTLPMLFERPPPSTAGTLVERGWSRYDAARFDNASTFRRSVYTVGYLQSWKYFAPVADRVRREFALTADAERAADSYFYAAGLGPLSKGSLGGGVASPVRVGVHVRRGDMLRQSHLYTVAPAEYLIKAIAHYCMKYAAPQYNVSFVFATDDHAWVRDIVTSRLPSELIVRYVNLDMGGDMAVLSRCDHSIVTGGTFGWWAAWLTGGDVVYYRDFIRPTSSLYARYSADDYYPPDWIGLSG